MAKIIHLPLDVRVEIISFLAAKKDLVAICNSCKAFYDAAIPRLYRRMTVTEDVDTEMLNAALGPENAGTQHVRHLEVVSSDGNEHSQKSSLDNVLSLLANLLPRDVLLTFFASAELTKTILAHQLLSPRHAIPPASSRRLHSLALYNLDLQDAASHVLQAVDCSRLRSLTVQKCSGTFKFFQGIMLTGLPPRIELESLILKTCTSMTEERDVNVDADFTLSDDNAFDLFLTSFSGLRILVIHLLQPDTSGDGQDWILTAPLLCQSHAHSLRLLFLHIEWIGQKVEDGDDERYDDTASPNSLRTCLSQCVHLEQLALASPRLILDASLEDISGTHGEFADAISAAPSLRTLRILSSPDELDLPNVEVTDHDCFELFFTAGLANIASEYLARIPTINALCLCHQPRNPDMAVQWYGDQELPPAFYSRGRLLNAYGHEKATALRAAKAVIQDMEPVSDIFDLETKGWRIIRCGHKP